MTHTLKTLPVYWDAIERGEKNFEVRRDDRWFQKGDTLELLRMAKGSYGAAYDVVVDYEGKPTHILKRRITYILTGGQFGIEPGYVVMALEEVPHA